MLRSTGNITPTTGPNTGSISPIVVNITLNAQVRPRVAQALRRHNFEIDEFEGTLSPEMCVSGQLIDGGTDERFLLRVNDEIALVVAKSDDGLVAIGTTTFE